MPGLCIYVPVYERIFLLPQTPSDYHHGQLYGECYCLHFLFCTFRDIAFTMHNEFFKIIIDAIPTGNPVNWHRGDNSRQAAAKMRMEDVVQNWEFGKPRQHHLFTSPLNPT